MAKKRAKISKKLTKTKKIGLDKPKKLTLMDRIPTTEIGRVELMIALTRKSIRPSSGVSITKMMEDQIERLQQRIEDLKKS